MNQPAYEAILALLDRGGTRYDAIEHEPCRTSEESQAMRAKHGFPSVVGAKALLAKLYYEGGGTAFATIVLPGHHVLDKDALIAAVPGLKKIRFATPEEMLEVAGVVPGCMPPFATPIFPSIAVLAVASALAAEETLGFNAAYLERSVILPAQAYLGAVEPTVVADFSVPK